MVGRTVWPMRLISQLMPSVGDIRSTFGRVPRDLAGEGVRRVAMGRQWWVTRSTEANRRARVGVLVNVMHFTQLLARGHASGRQDGLTRADRLAIHAASTFRSGSSGDPSPSELCFSPAPKSRVGEVENRYARMRIRACKNALTADRHEFCPRSRIALGDVSCGAR